MNRTDTLLASPRSAPVVASDAVPLTFTIIDERVTVDWSAAYPAVRQAVLAWFGWFATAPVAADYTVTIAVETGDVVQRAEVSSSPPSEIRVADGRFAWRWPDGTAATYDPRQRVVTYREALFCGLRFRQLLLMVTALRVLERGGLILHAGALVDAGGALLLVGTSGAGKSTLVRDAQPSDALADDLAVLRHEDGQWWAYRSPWWQGGTGCRWPNDSPLRLPVRAGFLLQRQPDQECCTPLTPPEAIQLLTRCLWSPPLPPDHAAAFHASAVGLMAALGLAASWHRLSYVRANGTPWRLLRAAATVNTGAQAA